MPRLRRWTPAIKPAVAHHLSVRRHKTMSHSVTTSVIAAVSKASYLGALKSAGFSRRGNHMFRPFNDLFHGIHFQGSRWGSKDEGKFLSHSFGIGSLFREGLLVVKRRLAQ